MSDQDTPNAPHVGPDAAYLIREKRAKWTEAERIADAEIRRGVQVTLMDVNARAEAKAEGVPFLINRDTIAALWGIGVPGDDGAVKCPVKGTVYDYSLLNSLSSPVVVTALPALGFQKGNIFVCSLAVQMERFDADNPDTRVSAWFKSIWQEATAHFGQLRGPTAYPPKPNRS